MCLGGVGQGELTECLLCVTRYSTLRDRARNMYDVTLRRDTDATRLSFIIIVK